MSETIINKITVKTKQMMIKRKLILMRLWQTLTIIVCIYLIVMAFMAYNWYPDSQTPKYNAIIGLLLFSTVVARLITPQNRVIPILIILDFFLITIISRAFINNGFWHSIFSVITHLPILPMLIILMTDYPLRYYYFKENKNYRI